MASWTLWFKEKKFENGTWFAIYSHQSNYVTGKLPFDTEEEADDFIRSHRRYYLETSKGEVQMKLW
jgi:hypothetical protein